MNKWGITMKKINLDALIPREDFFTESNNATGTKKATLSIEDLKNDAFFYGQIRKPDFQRETKDWTKEKIVEFIECFVNGDLIPAIILWRSSNGNIFIVDGSHRLSSLIAWINDDYGDGKISKDFFGDIPEEQIKVAQETRKLIEKKIGSYIQLKDASKSKVNNDTRVMWWSKNLGALAIQTQWVEGDATKAEQSFYKINLQATLIDKTEIRLINSRKKANCIAARAIAGNGSGHKYWSGFEKETQDNIESYAKDTFSLLFKPTLKQPIKTLELPIGGKSYGNQALSLILDFVDISNIRNSNTNFSEDTTGKTTEIYLKNALHTARRINNDHPSSLGLHPAVYFYSKDGNHLISSFYAIIAFIQELEQKKSFDTFTSCRETFEELIMKYEYLLQQINRKYRSAKKSYEHIKKFYFRLMDGISQKLQKEEIINGIINSKEFSYLAIKELPTIEENYQDFTRDQKSTVFLREALNSSIKCSICKGYINGSAITIDHIKRKREGGKATIENAQLAHPYCNTTYKQ
jgi:hypothetical protein